jgi:dTDP-4-dehydrorhamnose reductase
MCWTAEPNKRMARLRRRSQKAAILCRLQTNTGGTMPANIRTDLFSPLALWGGLEGTVNRVADQYFSQLEQNGHAGRFGDLERFASLGIRALRYPVLWERTAPDGPATADWSWPDARLAELRRLRIRPIVGLTHHGSGPRHTSLVDPAFAGQLAAYAGALARRYPWIEDYTPVNEPLTTARFSGLYGLWYPHGRDDRVFLRALLNQCRGVVLAMRAIRAVNAGARLIQTDDLGKTYGTVRMREQVDFYNARRWLSWDLLCGRIDTGHALWHYLTSNGVEAGELSWFRDNRCVPDLIGINHYITSERWLDHRVALYPHHRAESGFVDVEAVRAMATPLPGIGALLREAWQRYGLPVAVTEAHIDANREDQLLWLQQAWRAAQQARADGVDVRAVTVWALLGAFDWNSLVTRQCGYYESGAFDVRSGQLRPTALVPMMRELACGKQPSHPVLAGQGWWRRPERLLRPAAAIGPRQLPEKRPSRPILIVGADADAGLGDALARACTARGLAFSRAGPTRLDVGDGRALDAAITLWRPWALIHAAVPPADREERPSTADGTGDRSAAEAMPEAVMLAVACARHGLGLLCFSGPRLFDGAKPSPYLETDAPAPTDAAGRQMRDTESRVAAICADALQVRSGSWFGPGDERHFLPRMCDAMHDGGRFDVDAQTVHSPVHLPDLLDACLNLLIDRERGLWHLHHGDAVTDLELARRACRIVAVDDAGLRPASPRGDGISMRAVDSVRGRLLPSLDDALRRWSGDVASRG